MKKMDHPLLVGIYFIVFLTIFYLEPVNIGGLKFAIIWKLPIIILLLIYFISTIFRKSDIPIFIFFALLFSFKYFISISALEYLSNTISEFMKFAIFYLLLIYLNEKFDRTTLIKWGKYISTFIVMSFIPFMLGLLESLGKSIDISKYGNITGTSLTGIFQNPHAAGIVLAFALIIIFYNLIEEVDRKSKIFFFILLMIGIAELFLIMVRTSLAMFIIGAFYVTYKHFNIKHYLVLVLIIIIGFTYLSYNLNNPFVKAISVRLQGDTKYSDFKEIGSGRVMFANIAIDSWQSEGFPGIVIGLGMELGKDKMEAAIGARLFAHNGFLQVLQSEGIIGILLFLLFLLFLLRYIYSYRYKKEYTLLMGLFISYMIAIYFQGGDYFLLYVLFAIYLVVLSKEEKEIHEITSRL